MTPDRPEVRADLRDRDHHSSWCEVYAELDVDTDQHEEEGV